MEFILKWVIFYVLFVAMMCSDNLFWISKSPEYVDYKHYTFKKKVNYIFKYRIFTVITNWRDFTPALIFATLGALIL
jgi:hypothetical protein